MHNRRIMAVLAWVLIATSSLQAVDQDTIDAAVERGMFALRKQQSPGGSWDYTPYNVGSTSLAALTLLECGAKPEDPAVQRAVRYVRTAAPRQTNTYSIATTLLFLDRLGDPADVPLLQLLGVRLLLGQRTGGGWSYECPAGFEGAFTPSSGGAKPKVADGEKPIPELPRELVELLRNPTNFQSAIVGDDNSNTQFGTLGLWVARRHGVPVDQALKAVELRFRASQNSATGGWSYTPNGLEGSSPTMTAAGALCITVALGVEKNRAPAIKHPNLLAALTALGTCIGHPVGKEGGATPRTIPTAGGKSFYFLWTLERMAMAHGLKTIGNKDWYQWGAEILLVSQLQDGSWAGEYRQGGVDTCFALLFLVRSNLTKDLTARLKGGLRDPGQVTLKAGGVGGDGLRGTRALKPAIEPGTKVTTNPGKNDPPETTPAKEPKPVTLPDSPAGRLAEEILKSPDNRFEGILERIRDAKGVVNTEALAAVIPQLAESHRKKAREALAERLSRMKASSLAGYLKDEDAEIRRGAAIALAKKESKDHIPDLIVLLRDPEETVVRGAHGALRSLTGQDFGPAPRANGEAKERAQEAWQNWWKKNGK